MTDILIHKSSKYIKEDRDYYCSDIRDKHGMIKPSDDLISLSCDSHVFQKDINSKEICSIYYPFEKYTFDRIYLGISFPLFANNWGAAFLRYLMYLIKHDGAVILPVYAERQGVEKNYWSRSSLEVMFQSRQKWWGMSNIWAENDGVMSMRIGKKEPPQINSTLNYLLENDFIKANGNIDDKYIDAVQRHHSNGTTSAVIEQIIINNQGRKKPVSMCNIFGDPLLPSEILMSDYINVAKATQHSKPDNNIDDIKKFIPISCKKNLDIVINSEVPHKKEKQYDIITIIDSLDKYTDNEILSMINDLKGALNDNGIIVIKDKVFNDDGFYKKVEDNTSANKIEQYSSIVATKQVKNVKISHYSDIIFNELQDENINRKDVFNIISF